MTETPFHETLDRLDQENAALRQKLARHEFRQMIRELSSPAPFKLDVTSAVEPLGAGVTIPALGHANLAPLPVPMGSIHTPGPERELPAIGVHDDGLTGRELATALMGLMKTQYSKPIARLLFLCSGFEAVPFLGRYGFACEQVTGAPVGEMLPRLHQRYGIRQVRSLGTGAVVAELASD